MTHFLIDGNSKCMYVKKKSQCIYRLACGPDWYFDTELCRCFDPCLSASGVSSLHSHICQPFFKIPKLFMLISMKQSDLDAELSAVEAPSAKFWYWLIATYIMALHWWQPWWQLSCHCDNLRLRFCAAVAIVVLYEVRLPHLLYGPSVCRNSLSQSRA